MSSKILLVDDDMLLRDVIGEFLTSCGYDVDIAEDGEQALILFEPEKYKLALIDQGMLKMSGLKLMKEIQAQDPQVFCLIMTGYSNLSKVLPKVGKDRSDYIIKPFQLMELLNTIQKYT